MHFSLDLRLAGPVVAVIVKIGLGRRIGSRGSHGNSANTDLAMITVSVHWTAMVNTPASSLPLAANHARFSDLVQQVQIGSASCRGRGCQNVEISVFAVSLKKKQK